MTAGRGDPLLGTSIGNYRIERLIGRGGMGRVYEARHPSIGAQVAVKILAEDAAQQPDLIERFFTEARAVNVIRHERIVNVLDLGQLSDGRPYIVMEHLAGAPLSRVAAQGPMPLGSLARLMGEVLAGLAAAHHHGVVHRDLKPDNIFVTPAGHAKLLDFGIAKLAPELDVRSAVTHGSMLLGSPPYISPEHAAGLPTDARADIYAIGVILYECSTGRRPFEAPALFEILRQHIEDMPRPPHELRGDMPPAYEAVILQALAKGPEHRMQSAGEMADRLNAACAGLPPHAFVALRLPPPAHSAETSTGAATMAERPTARDSQQPPHGQGAGSWPPSAPSGQRPAATASPRRAHRAALIAAIGVLVAGALLTAWALGRSSGDDAEGAAAGGVDAGRVAVIAPAALDAGAVVTAAVQVDAGRAIVPAAIDAGATVVTIPIKDKDPKKKKVDAGPGTGTTATTTPTPDAGADADTLAPDGTEAVPTTMKIANPKKFDAGKFVATATRLVKKSGKDAAIHMIRVPGVRMDGTVDLTTGVEVVYTFFLPSRAQDPERWCLMVVTVQDDTAHIGPGRPESCAGYKGYVPRCTFKQVLQRARAKGAPEDGVYLLQFLKNWGVRGSDYGEAFDDDC